MLTRVQQEFAQMLGRELIRLWFQQPQRQAAISRDAHQQQKIQASREAEQGVTSDLRMPPKQ